MNFIKCLRASFLQNNSKVLLLKCRHCKNEARERDCLCCRDVDAMLIASAKIIEYEETISPSGVCPTISHTFSLISGYMSSFFGSWCSRTKEGGWMNLRFYLFVSVVNQMERERGVSPRFPFNTPGVYELLLRPTAS